MAGRWQGQRDKLIELRNENPTIRIRTADQLGVRTRLDKKVKSCHVMLVVECVIM